MGAEAFLSEQIIGLSESIDDRVASLLQAGTGITLTYNDGAGTLTIANTGLGGSTGSTDNRILRSDGTGGSTVQNSAVTIDDSGNISGLGTVGCSSIATSAGVVVGGQLQVVGDIAYGSGSQITWASRGVFRVPATNIFRFSNAAVTAGFSFDTTTNGTATLRNLDNSAAGALDCGAITASGEILPEANETRSLGSSSFRYLAGHFRSLVVNSAAVNPQIQIGASGEGYIERASSALQLGYGFSSNLSVAASFINANVPFRFPPYTVATLPNVATHTGRTVRVTDSSVTTFHSIVAGGGGDMVLVLSDGTNWRVR